jgi:hypothetical protein
MARELNWAGQPIRHGESYGGKPEHISDSWSEKLALVASRQRHNVVTEEDLAEVFGHGAYELPVFWRRKLLEELTGAHRTSCYRALRLKGRFARHLRAEGRMLSWR